MLCKLFQGWIALASWNGSSSSLSKAFNGVLELNHSLHVHGYLLAVLRPESALAMAEQNQFIWWLAPNWKRVAMFTVTIINHSVMFPDRGDFFNLLYCWIFDYSFKWDLKRLSWKFKYGFLQLKMIVEFWVWM